MSTTNGWCEKPSQRLAQAGAPLSPRVEAWRPLALTLIGLLIARQAETLAHAGEPLAPHDLWTAWSFEPEIVVPLALSAWLYFSGTRRLWLRTPHGRGAPRWHAAAFAAGWLSLVIALVSPLDALGSVLFTGHMLQHEVLMMVAAPLLVLSRPLVPMLWGLPLRWRQAVGLWGSRGIVARAWAFLTNPAVAWLLHALALWVWHAPVLYEATLDSQLVHVMQHASFFGSALLFWWALVHGDRMGYGLAFMYVFTTAVHSSMLGALLTFSRTIWYPAYSETTAAWSLTPLEDQQLGGLIMWVPAGVIFTVAALLLFAAWLNESERRADKRERMAGEERGQRA
jgi:putative membrane protein